MFGDLITLPEFYGKWFQYAVRNKRYRDGWAGKYYDTRYSSFLLPGISIEKNANSEYIDIAIDRKTLPSACKAGQATLLQAIYTLKSLSELSDNSDIKQKNAGAIQCALIRYLLPPDKHNHFESRLYAHFFSFLLVGLILSSVFGPAAILVLGFVGAVTGSFHHLFSWKNRINGMHEALVKTIDEANKQLSELEVSHSVQALQSSSPSQLAECFKNEKKVCISRSNTNVSANTSMLFNPVKKEETTVQESPAQAFSTRP